MEDIWEMSGCRGDIGEMSSTCAANRMEPAWVATWLGVGIGIRIGSGLGLGLGLGLEVGVGLAGVGGDHGFPHRVEAEHGEQDDPAWLGVGVGVGVGVGLGVGVGVGIGVGAGVGVGVELGLGLVSRMILPSE